VKIELQFHIPLMAERNISGHCDLSFISSRCFVKTIVEMPLLLRFVEHLSVLNKWVERTGVRGGWRPLLYLTFCIYLVREILFLSGKSQGILKTHVCGNHVWVS